MTFEYVSRPKPTRTYNRTQPFFDSLAEALKAKAEAWIALDLNQVPGVSKRKKQTRLHQEAGVRGFRVNTVIEGDTLLVTHNGGAR